MEVTLNEILELNIEVNGYTDITTNETLVTGFINQNIPAILKFRLNELSTFLEEKSDVIEFLKLSLVQKYGETTDDGVTISERHDNGNLNEDYNSFIDELSELLSEKVEITIPTITMDDIAAIGPTKDNYKILFREVESGG